MLKRSQNSWSKPLCSRQNSWSFCVLGNEVAETFENDIIVDPRLDMMLNLNDTLPPKNFVLDDFFHWPTTVIPIVIDPDAPYTRTQRALILNGLWQYHLYTCIRFVPRTTEVDYVFIKHDPRKGCSANVGRQGGRQDMNLRIPGCVTLLGTTIHEMLHNLGFFHEHSRPDRDEAVRVLWDHIQPGLETNFKTLPAWTVNTLNTSYDYDSVMQYSVVAFSKDRKSYTIYPYYAKPERLGQRLKFSEIDITKVNRAYKCPARLPENDVTMKSMSASTNGPYYLMGTPGVCNNRGRIDTAMYHDGELYLFKKGYYWIFKDVSLGRYAATHQKPYTVAGRINKFLPRRIDVAVSLENFFYFIANGTTYVLTSLDRNAVMDRAETSRFFRPVLWSVRGLFEYGSQLFFTDGSAIYQYDRRNDAIVRKVYFAPASGLPSNFDLMVNAGGGRLLIFKGREVYLTKRHLLAVERGYPVSFNSMFC